MLADLARAVEDGHVELNDKDLIQECKSYSRNDLMDADGDPRLVTRHFDLLIAASIGFQMKGFVKHKVKPRAISPIWTKKKLNPAV
jgi:hypothetical protein